MLLTAFAPHLTVLSLATLVLVAGTVMAAPGPFPPGANGDAPRPATVVGLVAIGLLAGVWIEWLAWRRRWPGT